MDSEHERIQKPAKGDVARENLKLIIGVIEGKEDTQTALCEKGNDYITSVKPSEYNPCETSDFELE